jgi:hypothetical protein
MKPYQIILICLGALLILFLNNIGSLYVYNRYFNSNKANTTDTLYLQSKEIINNFNNKIIEKHFNSRFDSLVIHYLPDSSLNRDIINNAEQLDTSRH